MATTKTPKLQQAAAQQSIPDNVGRIEQIEPTLSDEETSPPEPKAVELTATQKIKLLSDYANGLADPEVVSIIKSKPNGDRLYALLEAAVENEIKMSMNAQSTPPAALMSAQEQAQNLFLMVQRLGALLGAIEQGPALRTLGLLVSKLGGDVSEISQPQTPQPRFNDGSMPPQNTGRGRNGPGGSW